jgi:hypothetical protein
MVVPPRVSMASISLYTLVARSFLKVGGIMVFADVSKTTIPTESSSLSRNKHLHGLT